MTLTHSASPSLRTFNLANAHRPDRVVAPTGVDEIVALVREAARDADRIHPVGAGHGLTPIRGGVALVTERLSSIEVDSVAGTARVGAGACWGDVLAATAPHGLAPVAGAAPGVGVVGLLLGGGIGPVARTFGWASDHVRSFELVTGAGDAITASASEHPDLFWALRGGKRAPGVVTSVEIGLVPLSHLYAGGLFFAAEDAETALLTFASWSRHLPETVSASVALLRLPPLEQVPPPLRGRFVVHVRVAVVPQPGIDAATNLLTGEALVAPLRAVATPLLDTVTTIDVAGLGSIHADPEEPMPTLEGSALLSGFDAHAARALLEVAGPDVDVPFAAVELRVLGGALAHPPEIEDSVAGRDATHHLFVVSAPLPELFTTAVPDAAARLVRATAPWSLRRPQPNFAGALNPPESWGRIWSTEQQLRLDTVRRTYDPADVFAG